MSTRIIVVRHGETEANRAQLSSGHIDTPLTENGKAQAAATGKVLSDVHFDEIYSSDLSRAIDTAQIIAGQPVPEDHRLFQLRERSFGDLEGTPMQQWRDLRAAHAHLSEDERWYRRFAEDLESDKEVGERFMLGLQEIAAANDGKTVLVVAHGGCARAVLVAIGHLSLDEMKPGSFRNGGFIDMVVNKGDFEVTRIDGRTDIETAE